MVWYILFSKNFITLCPTIQYRIIPMYNNKYIFLYQSSGIHRFNIPLFHLHLNGHLCIDYSSHSMLLIFKFRYTISINSTVSQRITALCHFILTVPFHGMHHAICHVLHNPHMVDCSIVFPVKKDDVTCRWDKTAILKLTFRLEPSRTIGTKGKFGKSGLSIPKRLSNPPAGLHPQAAPSFPHWPSQYPD